MKSYLFSDHERRILKRFLKGETSANNPTVMQVKSRMKSWTQLRLDIDLYLELSKRFAEPKAAMYA